MNVQIWFLGKLYRVDAEWQSAEYEEGYLRQPGYWEIQGLTNSETGFDAWHGDRYKCGEWLDEEDQWPVDWLENDSLYRAVEEAFYEALRQHSQLVTPVYYGQTKALYDLL